MTQPRVDVKLSFAGLTRCPPRRSRPAAPPRTARMEAPTPLPVLVMAGKPKRRRGVSWRVVVSDYGCQPGMPYGQMNLRLVMYEPAGSAA
jgi:hypothetical protein